MLRTEGSTWCNVSGNSLNGLLCLLTFNCELWNYLLGNQLYSEKLFKIQKKAIRIITNSRPRDSCRELFKRLEILPLYSQYIFSISTFVVKNRHLFSTSNQIHTIHTRQKQTTPTYNQYNEVSKRCILLGN